VDARVLFTDPPDARMSSRPFLTAVWRDLVMLTWAVDARLLRPHLPRGVEIDPWRGDALASIVAFRMEQVRVRGLAVPCHTAFPEVNLRMYVRRHLPDGTWRRGVVFVREIVPRAAIAAVARRVYGEPYVAMPMREAHVSGAPDAEGRPRRTLLYEWQRDGAWERVVALAANAPHPMRHGSIEEFIAEHYFGYTARGPHATREYEVRHRRWQVVPLAECFVEADLAALYGPPWADALGAPPVSSFLADGSDVTVLPGRDVPGTSRADIERAAAAAPLRLT
jgi:uncharacterized protein YqjF (DUF2071 family)